MLFYFLNYRQALHQNEPTNETSTDDKNLL
jgi:hypothetical protein